MIENSKVRLAHQQLSNLGSNIFYNNEEQKVNLNDGTILHKYIYKG